MKFTIEVEDFYLDEGMELEQGLKDYVRENVIKDIWHKIDKKVEEHISRIVKEEVTQKMTVKMNTEIKRIIDEEKIKNPGFKNSNYQDTKDKEYVTLAEYLKNEFINGYGYNSPLSTIKDLAKKFSDELKQRYDLMFAAQIVDKMAQQGLLKENIAKQLIDGKQ